MLGCAVIRVLTIAVTSAEDSDAPASAIIGPIAKAGINPSIAYCSNVDGNTDIYLLKDGKHIRLTRHRGTDAWPAWSPDGRMIAFCSNRDGNYEIHSMRVYGSNQKRLTRSEEFNGYCSWSPDGKQIAFQTDSAKPVGSTKISVMDADGNNLRVLLDDLNPRMPAWSPDGRKIAFSGLKGRASLTAEEFLNTDIAEMRAKGLLGEEIYLVNVDRSEPTRLTDDPFENKCPAWSPDGKRIAFTSNRGGKPGHVGVMQVFVMNADGTELQQLTNLPGQNLTPRWSPDGQWITFNHEWTSRNSKKSIHQILALQLTDSTLFEVTTTGVGDDYAPAWQPVQKPDLRTGL